MPAFQELNGPFLRESLPSLVFPEDYKMIKGNPNYTASMGLDLGDGHPAEYTKKDIEKLQADIKTSLSEAEEKQNFPAACKTLAEKFGVLASICNDSSPAITEDGIIDALRGAAQTAVLSAAKELVSSTKHDNPFQKLNQDDKYAIEQGLPCEADTSKYQSELNKLAEQSNSPIRFEVVCKSMNDGFHDSPDTPDERGSARGISIYAFDKNHPEQKKWLSYHAYDTVRGEDESKVKLDDGTFKY